MIMFLFPWQEALMELFLCHISRLEIFDTHNKGGLTCMQYN
uniref:Uncharacterized protein n=1 Tax=Medicago truncatula TaxID=3880 RepID=I3SJR6_MEDTR|nr:unknown [Medicago truncatula]